MTELPTDRLPTDYVSIRLTVNQFKFEQSRDLVFFDMDWIAYPHTGKEGKNPHWHILVFQCADSLDTVSDRIRKRIKDKLELTGQRSYSLKVLHNGLQCGIQYCSREKTTPVLSDPLWQPFIDKAPKWVVQSTISTTQPDRCKDKDWQLTYTNLVCVAVCQARKKPALDTLKSAVKDLIATTKWRPSKYLLNGGVPAFYENDFLVRIGKRKEPDMDWWAPKFS